MLVFRLEHVNSKIGVYRKASAHIVHKIAECGCPLDVRWGGRHPTPEEEKQGFKTRMERLKTASAKADDVRFGFHDIEQYREWFHTPEARATLAAISPDDPLKLSVYKVAAEHVVKGRAQIVFDMTKAKLIARLDPSEF